MGYQLYNENFTNEVNAVSQTIFAVYHYHGRATGVEVSAAAPTILDGSPGNKLALLPAYNVILCCAY